jgi:predicted DNA-binding transcriptional regulator YafY
VKIENQKLRILYIIEILTRYTDEQHLLSAAQIIDKLKAYGLEAERKTVYSDINALIDGGILDVEQIGGRNGGFHVLSRTFELAELKMLVDAVQASNFVTNKQCTELIKKLSDFTSIYGEKQLSRGVYIYDRAADRSKNIYYTVDAVHNAISENKAVTFQYTEMTPSKEKIKRHGGKLYTVSPFALIWRDENYYLVAFNHAYEEIRHYRIDKIENIAITDMIRIGNEEFEKLSMSKYSSNVFEMFGGEEHIVHFRCDNSLAGAMFDRYAPARELSHLK